MAHAGLLATSAATPQASSPRKAIEAIRRSRRREDNFTVNQNLLLLWKVSQNCGQLHLGSLSAELGNAADQSS
jgi:hypothetical protein